MMSFLVAMEMLKVLKHALYLNFYGLTRKVYSKCFVFDIFLFDIMKILTSFQKVLYICFRATLNKENIRWL